MVWARESRGRELYKPYQTKGEAHMANQQYAHKFELGVPFHTYLEDYAPKWEELAWLRRDENGILEVQLHWGEGPCKFSESVHSGLVGLALDIQRDPENECIILTGTGADFLNEPDRDEALAEGQKQYPHSATYDWWWMNQTRIFNAFIDIPVPVIAAINGGCSFHPEIWLMSDYIFVSPDTYYVDKHVHGSHCIPADGLNDLVGYIVGRNRVKGIFLNGTTIDAQKGIDLGLWHEIVPKEELMDRARRFAKSTILCLEPMHRRMWREVFVQPFRELMAKSVRASLAQEAYAAELCVVKPGENHALQFREEFAGKMRK